MSDPLPALLSALESRRVLFRRYEESLVELEAAIADDHGHESDDRLREGAALLREAQLTPRLIAEVHEALRTAPEGPARSALETLRADVAATLSRAEARVAALRGTALALRDRLANAIAESPADAPSPSPYGGAGPALVDRTG